MSDESERNELKALKDGFDALTRESKPFDSGIAFTDGGRRRAGALIARGAATQQPSSPQPDGAAKAKR